MIETKADIVIVGAGLAGLACAKVLEQHGQDFILLEASNQVGGRVKTDTYEGFLLDHGFQVLLTAYPQAKKHLNYQTLNLGCFAPGACVVSNKGLAYLTDPLRDPIEGIKTAISPVGSLADKIRVLALRMRSECSSFPHNLTTQQVFDNFGFSSDFQQAFLTPFFRGIFLEPDLKTAANKMGYIFKMFSQGFAALPSGGMQAIALQLAETIPPQKLWLSSKVIQINREENSLKLDSGQQIQAKTIIFATQATHLAALWPNYLAPSSHTVSVLYLKAPSSPIQKPYLVLNGTAQGPINHVCFPSQISPSYAPANQTLVSVSVLGPITQQTKEQVLNQLRQWFGERVNEWSYLKTYTIEQALPQYTPETAIGQAPYLKLDENVYAIGDTHTMPSIQGALESGERMALKLCGQP